MQFLQPLKKWKSWEKILQIIIFCYFLVMATLNNVSLHTSMQIWSFLVKSFMAYMTMLDREVVAMTHRQIRGQMEVMLEADGFYFKFGMEMSSKTAFWFLFGMNISNTIHFMLFLRKKWKCADSIYTPCNCFFNHKNFLFYLKEE